MKIADLEKCCGCGNCEIACKQYAIKIEYDNDGFLKPVVSADKCINCHACEKVCPIITEMLPMVSDFGRNAYYGCCTDDDILKSASSGGIASILSKYIIEYKKGIVYGSRYSKNFKFVYTERIDTIEAVYDLAGSKYIQSVKNNAFLQLKEDLKRGNVVLYIGLPCDIAALKLFLKDDYKCLITCDLVCHGPTSTFIYQDYLASCCGGEEESIDNVNMRYKKAGKWYPYYFLVRLKNGQSSVKPFWTSDFGFAFSKYCNKACYYCKFKGGYRFSDITLGDAWGADKDVLASHSKGLSAILVNSEKGQIILDELVAHSMITLIDTETDKIIGGNPNLIHSRIEDDNSKNMAELFRKYGLKRTVKKLRPIKSKLMITIKEWSEREG